MRLTPIKAIRRYCLSCCLENSAEVRRCTAVECPLHPYRMGHRPKENSGVACDSAAETEGTAV